MAIANSRGAEAAYRHSRYSFGISVTCVLGDGTRIETWDSFSAPAPGSHRDAVKRTGDSLRNA
ncbi:MAG: hypothetical protein MUC50_22865, partial [Myxococcota bacterium]|nr:hypothetical protein [Myxococcota bacterium]